MNLNSTVIQLNMTQCSKNNLINLIFVPIKLGMLSSLAIVTLVALISTLGISISAALVFFFKATSTQTKQAHPVQVHLQRALENLKREEKENAFLKLQLEEAQNVAKIGSWSYDLGTQKLAWSKQMFSLFNKDAHLSAPDYMTHASSIYEGDRFLWWSTIEKCIEDGDTYQVRFRTQHLESALWIEEIGKSIRDHTGKIIGLFGTCQDISDRVLIENQLREVTESSPGLICQLSMDQEGQISTLRCTPRRLKLGSTIWNGLILDTSKERELEIALKQEQAKAGHIAKLASLGEMAAGIAIHSQSVAGSLPLLIKFKDDPEKFTAKIKLIENSTDRISKIVRGLRKFSRTTENTIHRPENLSELVRESLILTEAKSKRHSTAIEIDLRCETKILCDEVEIQQVIVNLVNNAIDAIQNLQDKWVKISVFDMESEVILQVTDSGTGISTEIENKLFDPFFTTKPVGEGTGLGLSISKGILQQHNASIQLNRSSKNTCFEIRFSRIKALKEVA